MRTIKLVVEYDGTRYAGWQRQPDQPTIQEALETAINQLTQHNVSVIGAGRTDAGVHALGQVASFRIDRDWTP
ncbi:MAG TPA: tRNA pseudouridine(38-40) synthase TruA, partial [Nitrospira sp.]